MARDQAAYSMSRRSDSSEEVNVKANLFVMTLCVALSGFAQAQDGQGNSQNNQGGSQYPFRFQLSSTTFANNDPQLPLIMIASQFFMQKMTPQPAGDPSQQKMMMMMPLIFGVMFWILALVCTPSVTNVQHRTL